MSADFYGLGDDNYYAIPENITTVVDVSVFIYIYMLHKNWLYDVIPAFGRRWGKWREHFVGLLPGEYAVSYIFVECSRMLSI